MLILLAFLPVSGCRQDGASSTKVEFKEITINYPKAFRDTLRIDTFFGKSLTDPYRWMEADKDKRLTAWLRDQASITRQYFKEIPYRQAIRRRLADIVKQLYYSPPEKFQGQYYYFYDKESATQAKLFHTKTLSEEGKLVFDPATLSRDGSVRMLSHAFSGRGSLMAFVATDKASDWRNIYVLETASGKLFKDTLRWIGETELAWRRDGFFYSRYPSAPQENATAGQFQQLYYHRIGDAQSKDELVFADRTHPFRRVTAMTTQDERYLVLSLVDPNGGKGLYFKDLDANETDFTAITEVFSDRDFTLMGNIGATLYFLTNFQASRNRIITINTGNPVERFWEELVPEETGVLLDAHLAGGKLLCVYLENGVSTLKTFDLKGKPLSTFEVPELMAVSTVSCQANDPEAFISFSSFLHPNHIYYLNTGLDRLEPFKTPEGPLAASGYEVRQVSVESYDNQPIVMYLLHAKDIKANDLHPTLLLGFGALKQRILPVYNPLLAVVLENGGVCAIAQVRGGGAYGDEGHLQGSLGNKQMSFDDLQAASQYLMANHFTSPEKLAIFGNTHGGLLAGACLVQRPDMYKAVVLEDPLLDMLRYTMLGAGNQWLNEYGAPEDERQFDNLLSYSPLHNLVPAKYPAVLITAHASEKSIQPAHAFKFTATLQADQQAIPPIILHYDGNGYQSPLDDMADALAFIWYNLKENVIYPLQ